MKAEIEKGLEIAEQFRLLGMACRGMSLRMRALIKNYSDEEIASLSEHYWTKIVPHKNLLEQSTADELIAIAPTLKELFEVNTILELIPKSEENQTQESE